VAALVSFYADEPRKKPDSAPDIYLEQVAVDQAHAFELGYPEVGVAYVRHPVRATRLIPLASYHPTIMVEKVNDAIAMLTALGAAEIVLAYSTEVSNEVRADLELLFGLIKIGAEAAKEEKVNVVYRASGTGAPARALPPLTWLDEPGWRGIVDGRLHGGLREFELTFTFDHLSGVDAELSAAVRKFGLRIGGDFRRAHKAAFELRGSFPVETKASKASASGQLEKS
jgi:hypothetical protein